MKTVNELVGEAANLSEGDRLSLASRLLELQEPAITKHVESAWDIEIRERIRRYEQGEANVCPASEVFREIDQMLAS